MYGRSGRSKWLLISQYSTAVPSSYNEMYDNMQSPSLEGLCCCPVHEAFAGPARPGERPERLHQPARYETPGGHPVTAHEKRPLGLALPHPFLPAVDRPSPAAIDKTGPLFATKKGRWSVVLFMGTAAKGGYFTTVQGLDWRLERWIGLAYSWLMSRLRILDSPLQS